VGKNSSRSLIDFRRGRDIPSRYCPLWKKLIVEQVVECLLSGVLAVNLIEIFGADHAGLEKIAEVGLFLVFHGFVDTFAALMGGEGIVESASPAALEIGQAGGAMIHPAGLSIDPRVFPAIPAAQTHGRSFPCSYTNVCEMVQIVKTRPGTTKDV